MDCWIERKQTAKKGDNGKILIIGGSEDYPFAGVHAALAAYAAGADVVTLISHPYAHIVGGINPAIIFNTKIKNSYLSKHDTLIIGMGLPHKYKKIIKVLKRFEGNVVIDATAIYAVAHYNFVFEKPAILTPHEGEFRNAFNLLPSFDAVSRISKKHNAVILLKGYIDRIIYKNSVKEVEGGSAEMAKAGTGDALAGVVGTYFSRFKDAYRAAYCASLFFKKSGELAAQKKKESLKPLDIIEMFNRCLR